MHQMERGAILFDLDNTLIGTRRADSSACHKLVSILTEQCGVPECDAVTATSAFLRDFRRCPDNPEYDLDAWRSLLWSESLGEEYSHLANDIYVQWLELRYHYLAINPEILSLLLSLRKHYLLGLITNGPSRAQWEKVERLHLREYFDCILVSGDLPWEKPDQKIFQEACQILGVEPKNCIMVGDKLETDIQGGKEAELGGTVWIPLTSEATDDTLDVTPDYTIDDVTQLPDILSESDMWADCCRFVREDDSSNDFIRDESSNDSNIRQDDSSNDSNMRVDDSSNDCS
ncbi:N-acylneuraminate-9-phosphatase isoform X2 [Arctopsyche grandis]